MSAHLSVTGNEINWPATPSGVTDVTVHNTLPKLLLHNARIDPNAVAQREKDFGIWQAYSWAEMNRRVSRLALGMQELGLQGGDVVGIIGDNRPEWVWAEVATHACKAMSLGLYRDTLEEEIFYLLDYAKPRIIVAEDEEQVDKFLMLEDRIPSVQWIIYHDARGMGKYDDPRLVYIDDVEARGQQRLDAQANSYELLVEDTSGDDIAILCTTSGTTSNPKLAMWRHDALLGHAANYLRADPRQPGDEYLAVLPLPWVMEQMYSVAWNLVARMTVNFPEQEHTAMHDLREIGPHFVLLSPRVWEVVAADVRARTMDSSKWKRAIYDFGVRQGTKAIDRGKKAHVTDRVLFRALRDQLGFTRLQSAATGGAAMGPDTFKYFKAMGVPLKQLYGQTEAMGAHTIHRDGDVDHETVGFPMPGCELKIREPDSEGLGEILVRHPNMMSGYYLAPEPTAAAFDEDGWFQTGDAGYLTENKHLVVIDRVNDLAETSNGIRFSPQFIENKLKFSTYIAEAVILGKDRPYLTAAICIRYPIVSKWAEENRIRFTTYSDLASQPQVYDLLRGEVERVNQTLPEHQRLRKFVLLYKELDADDGELTRTRKVRRGVIAEKYADVISVLYSPADSLHIDTVIHFQDGSSQRVVTDLRIEKLADTRDYDLALGQAAE